MKFRDRFILVLLAAFLQPAFFTTVTECWVRSAK